MKRIRFGVVGCGAVSEIYHVPAIAGASGREPDGVGRRRTPRARRKWPGGSTPPTSVADHRQLVGKVDAALIATSNTTHAEIACHLLEQGVHVLCEKPMATTTADAERMFTAAARGGARLMAGHSRRFNPNLELAQSPRRRGPHRHARDGRSAGARKPVRVVADAHRLPPPAAALGRRRAARPRHPPDRPRRVARRRRQDAALRGDRHVSAGASRTTRRSSSSCRARRARQARVQLHRTA